MSEGRTRGPFLTVMTVLFGLLAVSNCTKALQYAHDPAVGGIVISGVRFEGVALNLVFGPLMGAVLATYAYGLWHLRKWAAPVSVFYAFYVPVNLILFWYFKTGPDRPPLGFLLVYLAFALPGSIGTALYLAYHRERLA